MIERTVYVASRASVPARAAMWLELEAAGWAIGASWIREAGPGETACMRELWTRITAEIAASSGVVAYAEAGDLPLKGTLVECGMALALGKPVGFVLRGVTAAQIGSWLAHPLARILPDLEAARTWVLGQAGWREQQAGKRQVAA